MSGTFYVGRVVHGIRRRWWKLARPTRVGVRALALDAEDRVVLVRHTYDTGWYLPGGGVRRGESLEEAVRRELAKELGLTGGRLTAVGAYTNRAEGKTDHVVVFACTEWGRSEVLTSPEIAEVGSFEPSKLPASTSPGTRRRVEEWTGRKEISLTW